MEGFILLLVLFGGPVLLAIFVMKVLIPLFTGKTAQQLAFEKEVKRRAEQNERAYFEGRLDGHGWNKFREQYGD